MSGGSDIESVNSSNATCTEEVILFACIKCGQHCTLAEKDAHRALHGQHKRKRVPSPDNSEVVTIFQQVATGESRNVSVGSERTSRATKQRVDADLAKKKAEKRTENGKRRSTKNYNENVKPKRYHKG